MASTQTYTKTYSRIALLQNNIRAALAAFGWPKDLINSLVDIGLADDNRFIKSFHTFGMTPDTDLWELHAWVAVDWDEHGRLLVSNSTVTVDDRWVEGLNPGLIEQADGFGGLLRQFGLNPKYAWGYSRELETDPEKMDHAQQLMKIDSGTFESKPAGKVEDSQTNRTAGLGELSYGSESAFAD